MGLTPDRKPLVNPRWPLFRLQSGCFGLWRTGLASGVSGFFLGDLWDLHLQRPPPPIFQGDFTSFLVLDFFFGQFPLIINPPFSLAGALREFSRRTRCHSSRPLFCFCLSRRSLI